MLLKSFVLICWYFNMVFYFAPIYMIYYTYSQKCVETFLSLLDKIYLIMIYDFLIIFCIPFANTIHPNNIVLQRSRTIFPEFFLETCLQKPHSFVETASVIWNCSACLFLVEVLQVLNLRMWFSSPHLIECCPIIPSVANAISLIAADCCIKWS